MGNFLGDILEPFANVLGFEDETISAVAASSVQLYPEELENPTIRGIFDHGINGVPLINSLKRELFNGAFRNINRYYQYGKDNYYHGLPTSTLAYTRSANTEVDTILESLHGEPITAQGVYINIPPADFIIKYHLQSTSDYSIVTNRLDIGGVSWQYDSYTLVNLDTEYLIHLVNSITTTVVVTNEVTIVTADGNETTTTFERTTTTVDDGTGPQVTVVDSTPVVTVGPDVGGINDGVFSTILLSTEDTVEGTMDYSINAPIAGSGQYYTVLYALDSASADTLLWMYRIADGTYPTLEPGYNVTGTDDAKMFPVVPIRQNFATLDVADTAYDSTFGLLRQINISLEEQISNVESNESLAQIEDAFLHFGLSVYTQTDYGKRCLFDLFNNLSDNAQSSKASFDVPDRIKPFNRLIVEEGNFSATVRYNYLVDTIETGVIGEIGDCTNDITVQADVSYTYPDPLIYDAGEDDTVTGSYNNSYITLRKQLTSSTYGQVIVHGIVLDHTIPAFDGVIAHTSVLTNTEADQGTFIIPLGLEMLEGLTRDQITGILRESTHLTIYAREDVYVEWYKSEAFLNFVGLVGKFLAIVSLISGSADGADFLWNLGQALLVNAVLTELLVEGLEHADSDLEAGIYIAAYVYGITTFGSPGGSMELSNAEQWLRFVSVLTTALSIGVEVDLNELLEDQDALDELYSERSDELDEVYDSLNYDKALTPSDVYALVNFDPNEGIQEFYQRVAHTGNPGVRTLDQIQVFVDKALRLPEFEHNVQT